MDIKKGDRVKSYRESLHLPFVKFLFCSVQVYHLLSVESLSLVIRIITMFMISKYSREYVLELNFSLYRKLCQVC